MDQLKLGLPKGSLEKFDLSPVPVEITYGLERLEMFLEQKDDIYDLDWSGDVTYRDLRFRAGLTATLEQRVADYREAK